MRRGDWPKLNLLPAETGGGGSYSLSGLYLLTNPAMLNLPGTKVPVGIALKVTEPRKLQHHVKVIGSLSKPQRRRRGEHHQTKDLMSKTIAVHMHYKSLYISLLSSAKQEREMTKFCCVYGTWTTTANFWNFGIERSRFIFSVNTFIRPLAYLADPDNHEFRL